MHHPTLPFYRFFLLAALLTLPLLTLAQAEEGGALITVTITHDDGTVTVLKKRGGSGEDLKDMLSTFGQLDGSSIQTIDVSKGDGPATQIKGSDKQLIYIRKAGKPTREIRVEGENHEEQEQRIIIRKKVAQEVREEMARESFMRGENASQPGGDKPFLGVYLGGGRAEGVRISGVVSGSGAARAGLQDEDIITSIDGISLAGERSLGKALYQFEPGQSVTVGYLRNGQPGYAEVSLTAKGYRYSAHYEEDPCQVFIGVYTSTHREGGVNVRGVINNTPAFESGVQPGDIIRALDGVRVSTHQELKVERDKHALGDYFTLDVERDGQNLQIRAQFPTCAEPNEDQPVEPEVREEIIVQETPQARGLPEPLQPQELSDLPLLEYRVFPNPTVSYVNVQFQGEAKPMTLQLINNNGQVVYEEVQNRFDGIYNKRLNLQGMDAGTYYLRVVQDGRVKTEPLVVVPRV